MAQQTPYIITDFCLFGLISSDESLVCLANQSWWVYARRLVKAPSSFYNHLRQLLLWCIGDAVYFYCYAWQSVASSLRQCVGREGGGSSFTLMAGRKNKGILEDPQHRLKCTSLDVYKIQRFYDLCDNRELADFRWRMQVDFEAGVYYRLRLSLFCCIIIPPKCAANVLSSVRRTGRIFGGGVLMLFVILCS